MSAVRAGTYPVQYKHGRPVQSRSGAWRRTDRYLPTGSLDTVHCAGPNDDSPLHRHWELANYDAKCDLCWLGFPHTVDLHSQRRSDD